MPTYDNALFDPRLHTWDEVAQAMCQAELVHETIALLSFLPIAAGLRFGAYPVFIVTSVLSAGYDLLFVMMQRYNRQRIMALLERKRTSSACARWIRGRSAKGRRCIPSWVISALRAALRRLRPETRLRAQSRAHPSPARGMQHP